MVVGGGIGFREVVGGEEFLFAYREVLDLGGGWWFSGGWWCGGGSTEVD